jgi:hypothetical protein
MAAGDEGARESCYQSACRAVVATLAQDPETASPGVVLERVRKPVW